MKGLFVIPFSRPCWRIFMRNHKFKVDIVCRGNKTHSNFQFRRLGSLAVPRSRRATHGTHNGDGKIRPFGESPGKLSTHQSAWSGISKNFHSVDSVQVASCGSRDPNNRGDATIIHASKRYDCSIIALLATLTVELIVAYKSIGQPLIPDDLARR